jgi:hypothetical protein
LTQDVFDFAIANCDSPDPEPLPPHNGSPTSREAAESVRDHVSRLRAAVLDAIRSAGERGMTTDEVEVATGLIHQCASPRLIEIRRMGLIAEARDATGEVVKRPTRTGRRAVVYRAAIAPEPAP